MNKEQEIILNRMAALQVRLDGFEGGVSRQLIVAYKTAREGIAKQIGTYAGKDTATLSRLNSVRLEVEATIEALTENLTTTITGAAGYAGDHSYSSMNNILSWDGKVPGFNNVSLSREQIEVLVTTQPLGGKVVREWVETVTTAPYETVLGVIQSGKIRGIGYEKLLSEMDELTNTVKAKRDLDTINKSYIQAMNTKAQNDIYKANSDMVDLIEWSAIMENGNAATGRGTCIRCQALDGQQWELDDAARPNMPLHPRCRCMWLPITLTWESMGFDIKEMDTEYQRWTERDSSRGILDYGTTDQDYAGWWKTKPEKWQNNAIGPVRAELVRAGDVQFNDLVDLVTGRLYTIKELTGGKKPPVVPVAPAPVSIPIAKTVKEAEKIAKSIGLDASYRGFDVVIANGINRTYNNLQEHFPQLKDQTLIIGQRNDVIKNYGKRVADKELAAASSVVKSIKVNELARFATGYDDILGRYTESSKYVKDFKVTVPGVYEAWKTLKKRGDLGGFTLTDRDDIYYAFLQGTAGKVVGKSRKAYAFTRVENHVSSVTDTGYIVVNPLARKADRMERQYKSDCSTSFHPPKTAEFWDSAIITHEIGHNIDGILRETAKLGEWEDFLSQIAVQYKSKYGDHVSRYANKNEYELVAEAIADVYDDHGGSELSNKVVDKLKELLK